MPTVPNPMPPGVFLAKLAEALRNWFPKWHTEVGSFDSGAHMARISNGVNQYTLTFGKYDNQYPYDSRLITSFVDTLLTRAFTLIDK
jgi:hypothetical protein